jgi:GGDEF domain-containing protein
LQKKYGRDICDRALVLTAVRIRNVAKASDTLARVGDNQFGLLLEGPISASAANAVATQILTSGLRHSKVLPDVGPLSFHIGVGYFESSARAEPANANTCLAHMLQVVKTMNNGSGKSIRLVQL